jgi:host factor-I protein
MGYGQQPFNDPFVQGGGFQGGFGGHPNQFGGQMGFGRGPPQMGYSRGAGFGGPGGQYGGQGPQGQGRAAPPAPAPPKKEDHFAAFNPF